MERNEIPIDWEVASIQRWWKSHFIHIHSHHQNEDEKMNPYLRERILYPEKLEADHIILTSHLDTIAGLVDNLSVSGTSLEKLYSAWNSYQSMMFSHLLEEEHFGIPLMRAYFKPTEIGKIVGDIMGSKYAPKEEMGAFIYFLGEKKFREEFMKQEGIPFFVWWTDFKEKFNHYKTDVNVHIEALENGVAPEPLLHKSSIISPTLSIAILAGLVGVYFIIKYRTK